MNCSGKKLDNSNRVVQFDNVFIEEGAQVSCANLNATEGPIYIGKNAVVMEGASLRGPIVIGEKTVVIQKKNRFIHLLPSFPFFRRRANTSPVKIPPR